MERIAQLSEQFLRKEITYREYLSALVARLSMADDYTAKVIARKLAK